LRLWRGGVELDAGPRQQAQLLAVLLARVGQPVTTQQLVDLVWGDEAPATAVNVIHKYVGALRRILEPTVPSRTEGTYVRRRGDGYVFVAGPETLDLAEFRQLVAAAEHASPPEALERYVEALELWRGRPAEGLLHRTSALPVVTALEEELFAACVAAADLAVPLGRAARVVPALRLAASGAPFHEPVHAALVAALGSVGRQAEALAVYDDIRVRLAEELGIDPGHALREAHAAVLAQAPGSAVETAPTDGGRVDTGSTDDRLVGRREELEAIRHALDTAVRRGSALVVVEGEPGSGKTRVLEEAAGEAVARGALVVWGSCVEGGGTPAMWPWEQALGTALATLPESRDRWLASGLGQLLEPGGARGAAPTGSRGQFHLFEQVVALLDELARHRPLALVLDDLQWADATSLQLLGHVAARLPAGTVVLGGVRDRAPVPGSDLSRVLAGVSRLATHRRLPLEPLTREEVAELISRDTGSDPPLAVASEIHDRTSGNPFFVRELSRWLSDNGTLEGVADARAPVAGVPSTVRDVVRDRMTTLDAETEGLLRLAALIGREVEVGLLARSAGVEVAVCLAGLEPLHQLGLLEAGRVDASTVRFTHDLVRDAVSETTPQHAALTSHLAIADALEDGRVGDDSVTERLAYHLWTARALADPVRTIDALTRAGRRASNRLAFAVADRHLESAALLAREHGLPEQELYALSLLAVAPRRQAGFGGTTFDLLERAETVARQLGRDVDAAGLLFARLFGAYTFLEWDRAGLVRRLVEQAASSTDPVVQVYGRQAWGLHQWDVGNVEEAHRSFLENDHRILDGIVSPQSETPVRRDVSGEWPGWRAVMTALHGDPAAASSIIDEWNGSADAYGVTVWTYYTVIIASMAGDPEWVLRTIQRWMTVGSGRTAVQQEVYIRLIWWWSRALSGDDPVATSTEAQELLDETLVAPPRWGVAYHHALVAEMWLAAGDPRKAEAAVKRAEQALDAYGQRYAEGLVLLVRARVLDALGSPREVVREAGVRARDLAMERGAHLFANRAEQFLASTVPDQLGGGAHLGMSSTDP
jgi:DNA-binding SARP family transcriptional activator